NRFYTELFSKIDAVEVAKEPSQDYFSNFWLSCISFVNPDADANSNGLREALLLEDIESRPIWKPMHLQPIFKDAPFYNGGVSEEIFQKGLCLPSGSNLTAKDRERIETAILSYFNK